MLAVVKMGFSWDPNKMRRQQQEIELVQQEGGKRKTNHSKTNILCFSRKGGYKLTYPYTKIYFLIRADPVKFCIAN